MPVDQDYAARYQIRFEYWWTDPATNKRQLYRATVESNTPHSIADWTEAMIRCVQIGSDRIITAEDIERWWPTQRVSDLLAEERAGA